jgi:hypothetical protein
MDVELFAKLVALFDSDKLGEAEAAFRKAVVMCKGAGLRFCDVAGEAFGKPSDVDAAEVERMRQEVIEAAAKVQELQAENARLQAQLGGRDEDDGEEHVINLPGRLRHAWTFPQFRLFVLALAGFGALCADMHDWHKLAVVAEWFCAVLFVLYAVAQFHKRGLGQLLLKITVLVSALVGGDFILNWCGWNDWQSAGIALAVTYLLTVSKISVWMAAQIRVHFWQSGPVVVARGWF